MMIPMKIKASFLYTRLPGFLFLFFSATSAYAHISSTSCADSKTPIPGCITTIAPSTVGNTGLEVNFYAGASQNSTSNTSGIVFSPFETDTITKANKKSSSFVPGVGITYNYAFPREDYYIHAVSVGLNYYHTGASRDGQVYQYGFPQFNNYTYKMNISSNRVMLDGEVDLHPLWNCLTIFGEAGVGGALNNMSYNEQSVLGNGGALNLGGNTHLAFASEFGGGVKMPVNQKSEVSVRYLYANLGKAESNTASDSGASELTQPISTDLTSQSILVGYAYHLG
ncbi:MAG: outer membrane beta-barrel protein [Legionellales bacterium]|nr:outer membrane beta-barrel protein [Legionellales bacterium]